MKYFQSGEEGKKLQMLVDPSMVKKETVTLSHVQVRISYRLTLAPKCMNDRLPEYRDIQVTSSSRRNQPLRTCNPKGNIVRCSQSSGRLHRMSLKVQHFFHWSDLGGAIQPQALGHVGKGALPKGRLRKCPNILHAIVCFTNLGLPVGSCKCTGFWRVKFLGTKVMRKKFVLQNIPL